MLRTHTGEGLEQGGCEQLIHEDGIEKQPQIST